VLPQVPRGALHHRDAPDTWRRHSLPARVVKRALDALQQRWQKGERVRGGRLGDEVNDTYRFLAAAGTPYWRSTLVSLGCSRRHLCRRHLPPQPEGRGPDSPPWCDVQPNGPAAPSSVTCRLLGHVPG